MAKAKAKKRKTFLTPAQKEQAVRLFHTGRFTRPELAEKFDISQSQLSRLIRLIPIAAEPGVPADEARTQHGEQLIRLGEAIAKLRADADALGIGLSISITLNHEVKSSR